MRLWHRNYITIKVIYNGVIRRMEMLCNTIYYLLFPKRDVIVVNAYLFQFLGKNRNNNIGDDLNIVLLNELSGKKVLAYRYFYHFLHPINNLMAIGSVIEWMGDDTTTVWGAGIRDSHRFLLKRTGFSLGKVCAVRGKKTRECLLNAGISCPEVYGDPALLMPLIYRPSVQRVKGRVGIIPHYFDMNNKNVKRLLKELGENGVLIPVRGYIQWQDVIDLIYSCEFVISSSLHGLILSDAYGIPNQWVIFSDLLIGGTFKFDDYYSAVGKEAKKLDIDDGISINDILETKKLYQPIVFDPLPLLNACPFNIVHPKIRQLLSL